VLVLEEGKKRKRKSRKMKGEQEESLSLIAVNSLFILSVVKFRIWTPKRFLKRKTKTKIIYGTKTDSVKYRQWGRQERTGAIKEKDGRGTLKSQSNKD